MKTKDGRKIISCCMTNDVQKYAQCGTCMYYHTWVNSRDVKEGEEGYCTKGIVIESGEEMKKYFNVDTAVIWTEEEIRENFRACDDMVSCEDFNAHIDELEKRGEIIEVDTDFIQKYESELEELKDDLRFDIEHGNTKEVAADREKILFIESILEEVRA